MTSRGARQEPNAARLVVDAARLRLALAGGQLDANDTAAAEAELAELDERLDGQRRRLAQLFTLDRNEMAALDLAVAIAVEPALGPAVGALHGWPDRPLASEIALRLLFETGAAPVVRSTRPLVRWGLVRRVEYAPGEPICWYADPALVDFYLGRITSGDVAVAQVPAVKPLPEWKTADLLASVTQLLAAKRPVRVALRAAKGSGRASMARWLADRLGFGHGLAESAVASGSDGMGAYLVLQRMALLGGLALIWRGIPDLQGASAPMSELQFYLIEPEQALAPRADCSDLHYDLPALSEAGRSRLLRQYLPKLAEQMDGLLLRPTPADLAAAAHHDFAGIDEFSAWLRHRYGLQGRGIGRIETPQFSWDDLILPEAQVIQLENFAAEAKLRARLMSDPERRRIFKSAAPLSALLSGPPGLGKSMSAQVIARELGLDLLVVDASALISKYIGDTAKNYTEVFELARRLNAQLHFEEADGICQTRLKAEQSSETFRNIDLGHLLQLMERFEGPVVLSTNMRGNIDPAIMRRMRYIVEFRRPAYDEALRLWSQLLKAVGASDELVASCASQLASAHDLTPAQIKGAVVSAAYRALATGKPMRIEHVEAGVRHESLKEGKLVSAVNSDGGDAHARITPQRSRQHG